MVFATKPTFNLSVMAVDNIICKTHLPLTNFFSERRNYQPFQLLIPLKSVELRNYLSCRLSLSRSPRPPSFSLQEGISKNFVAVPPKDALVEVICDYEISDIRYPWHRSSLWHTSNGFILEKRRLLTCAHCIECYTRVRIKKRGSKIMYDATVLAIAPELDLAMLTIADDAFWEGVGAVELGGMPSLGDKLTIMSYLKGRNKITSRSGVLITMGMIPYSHWTFKLLAFKVDFDIESKQAGSAVFNEKGKCVGIAFRSFGFSLCRCAVIPVTIIKHFIQDYDKNGEYTGLPIFGVKWQNMENHDLCMSTGIQHEQEGVLIKYIEANCPELQVLKPFDVILSIDGVKIANDGTVPFIGGHRINFDYLFTQKYTGDNVIVKVLRDFEVHEYNIQLATHKQFESSKRDPTGRPHNNYYIIGGLVFTTFTVPYLQYVLTRNFSFVRHPGYLPKKMLSQAIYEEPVFVSGVLNAGINKGYDEGELYNVRVVSLNDKPIESLFGLVSMVESCDEEYLKFIFEDKQVIVLRTATAKETTPMILEKYHILFGMSRDIEVLLLCSQWGHPL